MNQFLISINTKLLPVEVEALEDNLAEWLASKNYMGVLESKSTGNSVSFGNDGNYDVNEITDRVYDTLMGNVGMSPFHKAFPLDQVVNTECGGLDNNVAIHFQLKNGDVYKITVEEADKNFFDED